MLSVEHVSKSFCSGFFGKRLTQAVDDVSFKVEKGEIFGLIGGSGSGKTTLSRIILGLLPLDEGRVVFNGTDLSTLGKKEWRSMRKEIQIIFQNPQKALNPRFTVYECCAEPLRLHNLCKTKEEEESRVREMLSWVGIHEDQLEKFPHEISGGQAQRVAIARALALDPELLICDEPTSMLDISVQAQIIDLLKHVNRDHGTTLLFISHDLDVVRHLCDHVAIMEKGKLIESGATEEVFGNPENAFTQSLLASAL